MDNNVDYKNKYLKYKFKYLELKNQSAGFFPKSCNSYKIDYIKKYNGTNRSQKEPILIKAIDKNCDWAQKEKIRLKPLTAAEIEAMRQYRFRKEYEASMNRR